MSFNENYLGVLGRGSVVWLIIIGAETLHGVIRNAFLAPLIGDTEARRISVLTGTLMIFAITFIFVRWLKGGRAGHFLAVGVMWIAMTFAFEVLLGRLVLGLSWERILADYDLSQGNFLAVGFVVMLFAPVALAKLTDEIP